MTSNVVLMPPRNGKQALVARLKEFVAEAERGEIDSIAVILCRPSDDPANPTTLHYRWNETITLLGAMAMSLHMLSDQVPDELTDEDMTS